MSEPAAVVYALYFSSVPLVETNLCSEASDFSEGDALDRLVTEARACPLLQVALFPQAFLIPQEASAFLNGHTGSGTV